jgi:hypothetical protein
MAGGQAAGGQAGGSTCSVAASVRWAQCRDGFTQISNGTTTGSVATLNTSNVLIAYQGQGATPDYSGPSGIESPDAGRLPRLMPEGTLRGTVRLDAAPTGIATLALLRSGASGVGAIVDFYAYADPGRPDGGVRFGLFCGVNEVLSQRDSAGNDINVQSVVSGPDEGWVGRDYDVLLRWRFNSFCAYELNRQVADVKVPRSNAVPLQGQGPQLQDLRLGVVDYNVAANNNPFSSIMSNWRFVPDAGPYP